MQRRNPRSDAPPAGELAPDADVGVVIPSRGRHELLRRALASVAAQTVRPRQVVVVLDGVDPELESELSRRDDLPLRVLVIDPPRGGAHARNAGIASLDTSLVAFLDDDDEWVPSKLERQLPLLETSDASYTSVLALGPRTNAIWPRRGMSGGATSEYLFDRRRPWSGAGLIHTSTILAQTKLLREVDFDESLRQHHDWDWALRAGTVARLAYRGEPLTIWHIDTDRRRLSTDTDWRESFEWGKSHRNLFTDRAYAAFLLVNVYTIALRTSGRRVGITLAREALAHGAPTASHWLIFAGLTILSPRGVELLRFFTRRPRVQGAF